MAEWTHQLPRPVGGASTRSSRCEALFLAQPSASAFPTADGQGGGGPRARNRCPAAFAHLAIGDRRNATDGQGGRHLPRDDASHPLVRNAGRGIRSGRRIKIEA